MAAGSTYTPIATTTLGSAQSSVSFSSFSGYTDLKLVCNFSYSANSVNALLRFNSDTGTNYSFTYILGYSGGAISGRGSNQSSIGLAFVDSTSRRAMLNVDIMNYSNSTTYKTCISRFNDSPERTDAYVGLWRNTAAITSLSLTGSSGNFTTGSTFTLYGIQAA